MVWKKNDEKNTFGKEVLGGWKKKKVFGWICQIFQQK
jgi:hypothetical protein